MDAYVLGAGVSNSVGYPLGKGLFDEVDKYVQGYSKWKPDVRSEWADLLRWLETNRNPAIAQAHSARNIEHIFTILDLVSQQYEDAWIAGFLNGKAGVRDGQLKGYKRYRSTLLRFLAKYFERRHDEDFVQPNENAWGDLRSLGERLKAEDVVITFNYDATLERVLRQLGKWSPRDGYGFELSFQHEYGGTETPFPPSPIQVLHLHGATGWYSTPSEAVGAATTPAGLSLTPGFLQGLGIHSVDRSLPTMMLRTDDEQILLHPSFLKDYTGSSVLEYVWRQAANKLRAAEHTYIIGYSLPWADAAAFTLFLTTLRREAVTVVNPTEEDLARFQRFTDDRRKRNLQEWLTSSG